MRLTLFSILTLIFQLTQISAQGQDLIKTEHFSKQGQVYFSWGYNREQFSKSNIFVKGAGYDFTLYDVKASDRPSSINAALFLNPLNISIPQFNFRIGYYLNDQFCITFGYDHMKYVVDQLQDVLITGKINSSASTKYEGTYYRTNINLQEDFFRYEHTNGLNYFSLAGEYLLPLYKSRSEKFRIHLELGGAVAFIMPRTDVFFFGPEGINAFHIAGYGQDINTGFRFDFGKHFFLRTCIKAGFINLPDVLTYDAPDTYAKQRFYFLQEYFTLNYSFWLKDSWKHKAIQN